MKLITKEQLLKDLPEHYLSQYGGNPLRETTSGRVGDVYNALIKESPLTVNKANEIIGNKSWTTLICNECRQDVDAIVQVGEEPDYESYTANVCADCLSKALKTLQS